MAHHHATATRYLDYSSGIGVTNTGHAHPRVAAAIAAQAAKLLHGQQNIVYHEPGLRLHERLRHVLPGGPWQAFLSNSGAEAVEASVKLARVATGRPVILAFRGGFHGRTAQTMALTTAKDTYRAASSRCRAASTTRRSRTAIGRPAGRTIHRPAPATGRRSSTCCSTRSSIRPRSRRSSSSPSSARAATSSRRRRSCRACARSPDEHGILLIADEVQTGFGRTGRLSPSSTGASSPTSWSWPRASRRGCRCPGSSPGEILDRWSPGRPRRHVRRQRRQLRGRQRDARRHRGGGPGRQRRARGAQLLDGLRALAGGPSGDRRRARPRAAWSRWSSSSRASGTGASRPGPAKRVHRARRSSGT